MRVVLMLLFAACAVTAQAQQVYKYVDKDGRVTYGDTPPPAGQVQTPKLNDNRVEVDKMSFETKRVAGISPVTLYVSSTCKELCDQARALLKKRNIPFSESAPETKEDIEALAKRLGGEARVPSITVGSKPVAGFEAASWHSALDAAGYPKQ